MKLCVNLVWPSKIIHFVMFDAKFLKGNFWEEKSKTLVWKLKLNIMCFEKILESFSHVTCHQKYFKNWFCRKISSFFKNYEFWSIECVFLSIKNFTVSKHDLLHDSIDTWSILDRSKLENFQFLNFWPNFFFMHHLCLGFTCIALFSISIL